MRPKNVFVISLIWDKRAIPLYWQLLDKKGSSNIAEQQSLITPILALLNDYKIMILGDAWIWQRQTRELAVWARREVRF